MTLVKIIATFERSEVPFKQRRLVVLQRSNGYFTFAEEYYYQTEYEGKVVAKGGWAHLPLAGIFETVDAAEAEARLGLVQSLR